WPEAYPDADPADVAVPEALDSLDQVDEGCFPQGAAACQATLDEPPLRERALETPPWPALAQANEPGRRPGASPVLIVHGDDDSLIPAASSALLVGQMCAAGATVHRRTYPGADHSSVLAAAAADTAAWIDARTAGQAAPDDCADGADGGGAGRPTSRASTGAAPAGSAAATSRSRRCSTCSPRASSVPPPSRW